MNIGKTIEYDNFEYLILCEKDFFKLKYIIELMRKLFSLAPSWMF